MLASLFLFGLQLGAIFKAISAVESDRGATSANVYQIRSIYVQDINRIYNLKGRAAYKSRDVYDIDKSEMMMYLYWKHYCYLYSKETGLPVTYEVMAKIHNGGPDGWKKQATERYWLRVKNELQKQGWKK